MPAPPDTTGESGQQDWIDAAGRPHRPDGPATVQLSNQARNLISWSHNGKSQQFLLFSPTSYYFASLEDEEWVHKKRGTIVA